MPLRWTLPEDQEPPMSRRPYREPNESPRDNDSAPWRKKSGDAASFGGWLRQQREIRSLTLREIADSTKIGMRYLEALETDRFERLPAPIFAKGFLRQYAKYVGLDPEEVVNFYLQASRDEEGDEEADGTGDRESSLGSRPGRQILLLLGIVAVALLLVGLFYVIRRPSEIEPAPTEQPPAAAAPVAVTPSEIPPEPVPAEPEDRAPLRVTLAFTGECWVEASVDGERVLSELRVQGESVQLEAERAVELTLGEPSSVRIEVNGEAYDPGVPGGRVARGILIDRATAGLPPLVESPGGSAAASGTSMPAGGGRDTESGRATP